MARKGSSERRLKAIEVSVAAYGAVVGTAALWITADVPDVPAEVVGWNVNSIGGVGPDAVRPASPNIWFVNNTTQAVFEVIGSPVTPVPEPSTLLLVAGGLVSVLSSRRRDRVQACHGSS